MKHLSILPLLLLSVPASAHPAHIAERAGHSHWIALGATAIALAIAVAGVARALASRRRKLANG